MDNWQQCALREDPYPEISFSQRGSLPIDSIIGLFAAAIAFISLFIG